MKSQPFVLTSPGPGAPNPHHPQGRAPKGGKARSVGLSASAALTALFGLIFIAAGPCDPPRQTCPVVCTGDTISGNTITGFEDTSGQVGLSINDDLEVVYQAYATSQQVSFSGVFSPNSVLFKAGDVIGGHAIISPGPPVINGAGQVAFHASIQGGSIIVRDSQIVAQTGDTVGGFEIAVLGGETAITETGEVLFRGLAPGGIDEALILEGTVRARSGDVIGGYTLDHSLGIGRRGVSSDGSQIAFHAAVEAPDSLTVAFDSTHAVAFPGAVIDGVTINSIAGDEIAVSPSGALAFRAAFVGGSGIFTPTRVIAKSGDLLSEHTLVDMGAPQINSSGMVAFLASFGNGSDRGIFTQTGALITTGSVIGSGVLTDASHPALNNPGDVAFHGRLSTGQECIFVNTTRQDVCSAGCSTTGQQVRGQVPSVSYPE